MAIVAAFSLAVAYAENVAAVIRDAGVYLATVALVIVLGFAAWLVGGRQEEKAGLWKYPSA